MKNREPIKVDEGSALQRYLYKRIFSTQFYDHFRAQYLDDVDPRGFDVADATKEITSTDDSGTMHVYLMPAGIAVARFESEDKKKPTKWAAFETKERVERAAHLARWAEFARGSWTRACPNEPGRYMVARRDTHVPASTPFPVYVDTEWREFQRVEGVVRDVTTHCPAHVRTEWQGYFWSEPLPLMAAPIQPECE